MGSEYILEMKNICKTFPGVVALNDVSFHMKKGEVHVLMGENGAGKSTLIKVLTGIIQRNSGKIIYDGNVLSHISPIEIQRSGISTIYQEIGLINELSVAENIFAGREIKKNGLIDWKTIWKKSQELLIDMGIDIDVKKRLDSYGTAIMQMVAIARAILVDAKIIVMDEPTSSLSDSEVKILFRIVNKLKKQGVAILFISHRMNEVFEIGDVITVLKDGEFVGEYKAAEITRLELISKMIGRDATNVMATKEFGEDKEFEPFLEAKGITKGVRLSGYDITVGKGEIVGMAGLLGSGRTELAKILFGVDKKDSGKILIDGKPTKIKVPKDGIGHGIAFCSEDRKIEGVIPNLSVKDNMMLSSMNRTSKLGVIRRKLQDDLVAEYIQKLKIKTPNSRQAIKNLSGGNQQKVLLARWLCTKPDLIILDEPTRGIDVGAKKEIEDLIQNIADQGIGVLLISSEFEELIRNCDRIEIIREGKNVGSLSRSEISEENIILGIAGKIAGGGNDDGEN